MPKCLRAAIVSNRSESVRRTSASKDPNQCIEQAYTNNSKMDPAVPIIFALISILNWICRGQKAGLVQDPNQ